jgi:hypothetical protein
MENKETLELAAEKWFKEIGGEASFMKAIEFGTKWQQEQIYNQIKQLYDNENITGFSKRAYAQCLDIIEQFKKK